MFSLRTTWGTITIILADVIICYLIFWLILSSLPGSPEWLTSGGLYGHLTFSVFTLLVIFSLVLARLYSFMEYTCPGVFIKQIIPVFLLSLGFIAMLSFFIKGLTLLNWRLFPPVGASYACLFVFRYFVFYGMVKNRERILVLGTTDQAREIINGSQGKKFIGYEIIGIVTSMKSQVGKEFHGIRVLSHIDQIDGAVRKYAADSIVVTLREQRGKLPVRELLKLKVKNIRIQEGPTFYEKIKRKIIIDEFLKPSWIIFEDGFFHNSLHGTIKRTQGVIVSFISLTILSPILLLVAILIKLESPGPVFFQQERVGRNGKIFHLLKFRSMHNDAETISRPVFTQENDPRVTRVGRIIRKTRIDEVPQFINIFKGDMDMVGPRPERPFFVKQLEEMIPYYNLRHTERPGVTGWAQVNYPYGDSLEDSKEKLKYDLYYLKHFSWYLDLQIIFLTAKVVLFGKGR